MSDNDTISIEKNERPIDITSFNNTFASQMLKSLAGIYVSMHILSISKNTYQLIDATINLTPYYNLEKHNSLSAKFPVVMRGVIEDEYADTVLEFINLKTLDARLKGKKFISKEYLGKISGWCRASFIPVSYDKNGKLDLVIFVVQKIDEEKKRELEMEHALKSVLKSQNEIYAQMFQQQGFGLMATNVDNDTILVINEAGRNLFKHITSVPFDGDLKSFLAHLDFNGRDTYIQSLRDLKKNGGEYAVEIKVTNYAGNHLVLFVFSKFTTLSSGQKVIITTFADITEQRQL